MAETVHIIGAGIGGLTTALTLKQKGLDVTLFERASAIKPVGAGIILANNAMQVFRKLGIHDKIEQTGNKVSYLKITDTQLDPISVVDLSVYERKYGVCNIAIHRGELQKILANAVGYENIQLAKRLSTIEKADVFKLTFEDRSVLESKLVIGADGIRSVVRNQLFEKSSLRAANQRCWRGICEIDLPENYHHALNEAWGRGKRFGFVKIGYRKVYWYALANSKHLNSEALNLADVFKDFHRDVLAILSATLEGQILESEIYDLKPINTWQAKDVCLIGDAAHATTPNLGQGACQAVEDAYVIGKLLDDGGTLANTFKKYEAIRRNKAHQVVNTSWMVGKMAHIENRSGIWLRNFLMKNLSKSANKKQLDFIFNLP